MLIKDAVSQFGPFFDKQLGWIAPRFPRVVPRRKKGVRQGHKITRLPTASTLLGVRIFPVNWVFICHQDVGRPIRGAPLWRPYDSLTLAIPP